MAFVNLPPWGSLYESEKRREKRIRESTSPLPVERWRLREERIQDELKTVSSELVRQAIQRGSKR